MNAPDIWADFAQVFAAEIAADAAWTPEQMDAMAEEYARAEMAGANSPEAGYEVEATK